MSAEGFYMLLGVVLAFLALSWWAIRDAFSRDFSSPSEKMIWVQVSVIVPFLGGIVYLLFGRKRGSKPS